MKNYGIKDGYKIRQNAALFDDTPFTDEFQDDVYRLASQLPHRTVLDVGCGSGFKLIKYFPESHTIGYEIEPTLTWLRQRYPDRIWRHPASSGFLGIRPRLVICADVIEHVPDPDALLLFVRSLNADHIVFSTPDRDLLKLGTEDGPPKNIHHVREWTHDEFVRYIGEVFEIKQTVQGTTIILYAVPA